MRLVSRLDSQLLLLSCQLLCDKNIVKNPVETTKLKHKVIEQIHLTSHIVNFTNIVIITLCTYIGVRRAITMGATTLKAAAGTTMPGSYVLYVMLRDKRRLIPSRPGFSYGLHKVGDFHNHDVSLSR